MAMIPRFAAAAGRVSAALALTLALPQPPGAHAQTQPGAIELFRSRLPADCRDHASYQAGTGFTVLSATCDRWNAVWLLKDAPADGADEPSAEVVDERRIALPAKGRVFLSGPFCYDKADHEVVLSGTFRQRGGPAMRRGDRIIVEAWVPDTIRGKMVRMPRATMRTIRCFLSDDDTEAFSP